MSGIFARMREPLFSCTQLFVSHFDRSRAKWRNLQLRTIATSGTNSPFQVCHLVAQRRDLLFAKNALEVSKQHHKQEGHGYQYPCPSKFILRSVFISTISVKPYGCGNTNTSTPLAAPDE